RRGAERDLRGLRGHRRRRDRRHRSPHHRRGGHPHVLRHPAGLERRVRRAVPDDGRRVLRHGHRLPHRRPRRRGDDLREDPEPVRKLLLVLAYLIILVGLALLIYSGTRAAHFSFITDEMPPPGMAELPWPTWWWKTIIPVAAALGCVVVLIDLYRELTAPLTRVVTD